MGGMDLSRSQVRTQSLAVTGQARVKMAALVVELSRNKSVIGIKWLKLNFCLKDGSGFLDAAGWRKTIFWSSSTRRMIWNLCMARFGAQPPP